MYVGSLDNIAKAHALCILRRFAARTLAELCLSLEACTLQFKDYMPWLLPASASSYTGNLHQITKRKHRQTKTNNIAMMQTSNAIRGPTSSTNAAIETSVNYQMNLYIRVA